VPPARLDDAYESLIQAEFQVEHDATWKTLDAADVFSDPIAGDPSIAKATRSDGLGRDHHTSLLFRRCLRGGHASDDYYCRPNLLWSDRLPLDARINSSGSPLALW
jgi:hypothetical protein